jgi:hypothetical protein
MYEIQTTTIAQGNTTEALFNDHVTGPEVHQRENLNDMNREVIIANKVDSSLLPLAPEIQESKETDDPPSVRTVRDVDEMYSDDNDGKIARVDRCCFLWFC